MRLKLTTVGMFTVKCNECFQPWHCHRHRHLTFIHIHIHTNLITFFSISFSVFRFSIELVLIGNQFLLSFFMKTITDGNKIDYFSQENILHWRKISIYCCQSLLTEGGAIEWKGEEKIKKKSEIRCKSNWLWTEDKWCFQKCICLWLLTTFGRNAPEWWQNIHEHWTRSTLKFN